MAEKLCRDCETLGMKVAAHRILPGGTGLCDDHWRKRMGMPSRAPAKDNEMPPRKNIDWNAVQADRDAGMPVAKICEKYGVSNPTVYTKTKPPANGKRRAGGGGKKTPNINARRSLHRRRRFSGYRQHPVHFAQAA